MQKHVQRLLLIAVMLLVPWVSQAQTLGEYTYSTGTDTSKWIDMSSATQILTPSNSDALASSVRNIGFAFPFGENYYTEYSVNTDGNLRLGSTVTGNANNSTPFSSANANVNNPKINFFGCDGYGVSGSHYVKALNTVDSDNDSLLCVEFCTGTYNSNTRNNLYKWQVHLYTNGNIEVVYGAAPANAPNATRQPGLCISSSDGWTVNASHVAAHFTAGVSSSTVSAGNWPSEGRYYRFAVPIYSCPKPVMVTVGNLGITGFDISWTDTSDATSWIARLTSGDSVLYNNVTNVQTLSFTGLNPATRYNVQVAGLCQNGDTSRFRTVSVITPCAIITTLPYLQNFDSEEGFTSTTASANNLPPCWASHNTGTHASYSGYPIVYRNVNNAHSGNNSLRFYTYVTAGTYSDQIAILPPTDSLLLPVSDMQLSFWMRSTSASYNSHVVVGVMSDPTDASTFVPVETVYTNNSTTYAAHTVTLATYSGPHGCVAIKAPRPASSYNALYIDDVTLEYLPNCLPVQHITTGNATPTSITVSWTEIGASNSWRVVYMPVGSSTDSAVTIIASDTVVTLTGLSSNTEYTVMVVADCGSEFSDTTVATFLTPCAYIATLPYTENFDWMTGATSTSVSTNNLPPCWHRYNTGTNTSYTGYPIVYSSASYAHSGTNAVRFYTYVTAGAYSDQMAIMPLTDPVLLPVSTLQVLFWMRSVSTSYNSHVIVGVMSNPEDVGTFVPVDTVYTNNSDTYQEYSVMLGRYTGPHGCVAFKVPRPSSSYNALMIDDITLDIMPACPSVDGLTVTHVDIDSVGIRWRSTGAETRWIVGDGTNEYVVTNRSYTFVGLTPNTMYTFSVRALCSATSDTSDAVTVTARTLCTDLTILPYREDFDSYVGSTATNLAECNLPFCWRNINRSTRNNYKGYPIIYNHINARSGGNCMRFHTYYTGADSTQYAILPQTDSIIYPVSTLKLSFYMRSGGAASTYKAEAIVGVITNPLDERTFVPIDTVNSTGSIVYSYYEISFSGYSGPHGRVALKFPEAVGSGYNYNSGCIDDLVLDIVPDCPLVTNLAASNIGLDSVDVSWTDTTGNSSWTLEYGVSGFTIGTGTVVHIDDTAHATQNYLLTGLSSGTAYDVYVTPFCAAGMAGSAFITFRTECGTIDSLPFFEDFESYPIGTAGFEPPDCGIPCWHRIDNTVQNHIGYIGNSSLWPSGGHSGTKFLYYYIPPTGTSFADWTITTLPPVNTALYPANTLKVSFWAKMDVVGGSDQIVVGVMTDPTEDSTFVAVDSVPVGGIVYALKEVSLSSYTGNGAYIALRVNRNPSAITYIFVDDIMVEQLPSCPQVEYVTLMAADSNTLTLSWVESGSATSWTVEYGVSGFTPGTGTGVVARTLPFVVNGLTQATYYDFYITPVCPGGTAETRMVTFRTPNNYITIPFYCGFEDTTLNALWALENGGNVNRWCIDSATNNGGSYSLYVTNDNGVSNSYLNAYADAVDYAYVDVMFAEPGDYGYSFDWRCQGESTYDYMRAALIPVSESLTASSVMAGGFTVATMTPTWLPLDGGCKLNLHSTWQTHRDVVHVSSAGAYHLTFIFRCDGSGGSMPPPAVDNIMIIRTPCTRPDSVVVSNLTQTSVDFAWSEMGFANEWQYQIDSGIISTLYTTHVSLTGLTANTSYTFKVRAVCGAGDTSFWRVYEFHTPCTYISIPYTQDFETESTGTTTGSLFANCWTRLNNGLTYYGYPYISSNGVYNHTAGGTQGLYWYCSTTNFTYGDYQIIVLPPFDTTISASSLQLSFWTKATTNAYTPVFKVGVMTDPNNPATFVCVDTVTINGYAWREVTVPLSSYTGNGNFVAIRADRSIDYWYAYVDDITLNYITSCFVPTIVYSTNATSSSITLDWVDISYAPEWQVEYGPQGYLRGSSTGTVVTTTSHPVVINGLDYLTAYDFYVRPICSIEDSALWGYPTTLSTGMCDYSMIAATGNSTAPGTNYRYPVTNYYNYSLTETIIDSAELGGEMDIEYISYYYDYSEAMTDKDNCTIYFQPTTKTTFSSSSDVEALDPARAVMVYTGSLNCSQGWNYFVLDSVYHYDGIGNLMVIVDDNSNDYNSTTYVFKTDPCNGYKTLYYYSDTYNPNPTNISSSYSGTKGVDSSRVVMQLVSCSAPACRQPSITDVAHTFESVTVTWTGEGTEYKVNLKERTAADWPATDIHVTGNSYTFTGLQPITDYVFRVRQDCTSDSLGYSEWVADSVLTDSLPCLPPDSLTVGSATNAEATFDWLPIGYESVWELHVWFVGGFDSTYIVSTHPATVGGFTSGVTYNASVRALCGSAHNIVGEWGDSISFTTAICPDVVGLHSSDVSSSSVTVYWEAGPMAQRWEIEYGLVGFQVGTGTTDTTTVNSYEVTGLLGETSYEIHVRAVCGTDWYSENWTSVSATTLAETVPCDEVSDLTADNVTKLTAHITWTPGATGSAWQVELADYDGGAVVEDRVTATDYMFTGLTPGTRYVAKVRTDCGDNQYSDYRSVSFTTQPQEGIDEVGGAQCAIYPNPTSSATTIRVGGVNGKVRIEVVDMNGREVRSETFECANDCEKSMDVEHLAQGAYFVRITGEYVNMVRKLVVR